MKYLAVMFISPLYFAVRGMWGGFVINLGLYFLPSSLSSLVSASSSGPSEWLMLAGISEWR